MWNTVGWSYSKEKGLWNTRPCRRLVAGGFVEQCPPECGTLFLLQFLIMCLENHIRD